MYRNNGVNIAIRLFALREFLYDNADETHAIKFEDIRAFYFAKEFKFGKEDGKNNKTIYSDLHALQLAGVEIEYSERAKGWILHNPPFEANEVRLIIDSVQASKFITQKKAASLTKKIIENFGGGRRQNLNRHAYVYDRIRSQNDEVVSEIDSIHEAITANRKIEFKYFRYTPDRRNPKSYTKKGENYNFSIILKQEEDNYLQKLGIAKSMEEDFQQKLNEKDEQITKLKTENSKRQKEIENIKNITASEKDSLSSLINKKDTEIAKLKEDFNKKELTIKRNYQQDCEGLASKLKEESSLELKRLSTQLKEKEGEITELKAEISELRAALKDPYKKASEDLESKLQDEYEKRILQLKTIHERELKDKTDEYDKAKKELENQIKEEKSVHNKEITKLQSTIEDINSNHQEAIEKLKEQVRSEAETFKSEVEKGVHDLQKRIKELEFIVEQKNEEIRQLQSKQSKGLFGIFK